MREELDRIPNKYHYTMTFCIHDILNNKMPQYFMDEIVFNEIIRSEIIS